MKLCSRKDLDQGERVEWRVARMVRRLEHLCVEERLRAWVLLGMEERMLWWEMENHLWRSFGQ